MKRKKDESINEMLIDAQRGVVMFGGTLLIENDIQ